MDEVALGQVFFRVFLSPPVSSHLTHAAAYSLIVLLSIGHFGVAVKLLIGILVVLGSNPGRDSGDGD
jgi:hypothetical protein